MNPYEILEIPQGATGEEIKAAYHRLAKQWHPDRFTGADKEAAEAKFRALAEAFNMVKDAGKREETDRRLPAMASEPGVPITLDTPSAQERTADDWIKQAKGALENRDPKQAVGFAQMAIRMDASQADYHVVLAKALDMGEGDRRVLVKTLETVLRLNPKDADSTIRLAELFQELGMYARATRLWETARNLAPNHRHFIQEQKAAGAKARLEEAHQGLGEQFTVLIERLKGLFHR